MGSALLLLPALLAGSLPPATLTLLMTGEGLVAAAPTETVKVMGSVEVLAAIAFASDKVSLKRAFMVRMDSGRAKVRWTVNARRNCD